MTFKILTSDTNKVIFRSAVRPVTAEDRNLRTEQGRNAKHCDIFAPDSEDGETFYPSHNSFQNSFATENDLNYSSSVQTTSPNGENGENHPNISTVEPSFDEKSTSSM